MTRVRKGHVQGHVTVTLTYKVTLDSYSVDLYLFDIRDPKNLRNKKNIIALASLVPELEKVTLKVTWPWHTKSRLIVTVQIYFYLTSATPKTCETKNIIALASLVPELEKVTLRVTWPWHTKSRLIVTVWIYIYLTSATSKTCETKKYHRSSVTSTRVRKDHAQGHVTLTYKVTLDSYSVDLYLFEILDPKNLQNKKIHRSSISTSRYIPKCQVFNILTFRGCHDDVLWRQMTSSIITLTILDSVWHISRKSYQRNLRYSHFPQDSD